MNRKRLIMKQACQKSLVIFLVVILAFALGGCDSTASPMILTRSEQLLSPTFFSATDISPTNLTVTPTSTESIVPTATVPLPSVTSYPTNTPTRLNTLRPEVAEQTLQPLFRKPLDCAAPCLWGIIPQKTTLDEANLFFNHLGLKSNSGIDQEKGNDYFFDTTRYESSSGLSSRISLYGYKNLVETIWIQMSVPNQDQASRKEWVAYSPETLIKRYGNPSQVYFILAFGPDTSFLYEMLLYFDANSMIVKYIGHGSAPSFPYSPRICPSTALFENVWIWLGDNPRYPPRPGLEIEKATSLTIDQFSQLILGNPQNACFTINGDAFQ